jgi:CDP-diacylglycerol---glycerol-3-phosphate 3-phosphatidyltransferase
MTEQPVTLTDRVRGVFSSMMSWIGTTLHRLGVHPDAVTIFGLLMVIVASVFIGMGDLRVGGVILLLSMPLDAVDGAVARAMQRQDKFGAMLDSALDRYADGFIFAALSYHFAVQGQFEMVLLSLAALLGSFMVSYVRARAEGLDVSVKIGILSRMERAIVILLMLLVPGLLIVGLLVLALGTNFTGFQRLWFVYRTLRDREVT